MLLCWAMTPLFSCQQVRIHNSCMLGNFTRFFCRLLTFFKVNFQKNYFGNTIRVSNCLDPDQDQQNVGLVLGPNCLQRLTANDQGILLTIFKIFAENFGRYRQNMEMFRMS